MRHELEIVDTFRDRIFSDASSWHDVEIGDERYTNNFHPTAGCKLSLVIVAHRRLGRKPATLEIVYDMKIDFLLCNLYFPLNQKSVIGTARLQIT